MRPGRIAAATVLWAVSGITAHAQGSGEQLRASMPRGFKIIIQASRPEMKMMEAIPQNQTLSSWTEMLTVQVFNKPEWQPSVVLSRIGGMWLRACPGSMFGATYNGLGNGYPVSMIMLQCPFNPKTKLPESVVMRGIQGQRNFYLIQYAMRSILLQSDQIRAIHYLGGANICNPLLADRSCSGPQVSAGAPLAAPATQGSTGLSTEAGDAVFLFGRARYFHALVEQRNCILFDRTATEAINHRFESVEETISTRYGVPDQNAPLGPIRVGSCDQATLESYENHVSEVEHALAIPSESHQSQPEPTTTNQAVSRF